MKLFIPIRNQNDTLSLLQSIVVQATLPTALKKVTLIRADFTLEDDTDDTSQTELMDISTIDVEKRRANAKKAIEEACAVIEKLITGDQKETKPKKITKQKQESQDDVRYFGTAYVAGPASELQPIIVKPVPVDYEFYELWKLRY